MQGNLYSILDFLTNVIIATEFSNLTIVACFIACLLGMEVKSLDHEFDLLFHYMNLIGISKKVTGKLY